MSNMKYLIVCTVVIVIIVALLTVIKQLMPLTSPVTELALKSTAFIDGGAIPEQYTCNGASLIPPLTISGVPKNTVSMTLLLEAMKYHVVGMTKLIGMYGK